MTRQLTRRFAAGLVTFVPGLWRLAERATGGSDSASYCYEIWLRHLHFAAAAGLDPAPATVAEAGPGDTLGTGIAALLAGASTYVAVDLVRYAATERDVAMVDQIRGLFAADAPAAVSVGGQTVAPEVRPSELIGEERAEEASSSQRADAVRAALRGPGSPVGGLRLLYAAGAGAQLELDGTVDALVSQAVLEHVDDLDDIYAQMHSALRRGGWMSHTIDFKSHDFARDWNGHWTLSDLVWALIRGRRRYAINRLPLSAHLRLIEEHGFDVVAVRRATRPSAILRSELAPRFRGLTDEDLETASAVIQAVKR